MKCTDNKIVGWIDTLIAKELGIKHSLGETLQIQKYCAGEYYKEHNDYFNWNTDEHKTCFCLLYVDKLPYPKYG